VLLKVDKNEMEIEQKLDRIFREARILAMAEHPNILAYFNSWFKLHKLKIQAIFIKARLNLILIKVILIYMCSIIMEIYTITMINLIIRIKIIISKTYYTMKICLK
jgi:hypothetical protein